MAEESSNQSSNISLSKGYGKAIWIFLGVFFLFFVLGSVGGLPVSAPTGETAPLPPGTVASAASIASCRFIHQGRSYKVNSSKLQSLIEEVSAKTGVPSAALAAIAIQETPDFAIQDRNDHPAFSATDFSGNGCDPYFLTSVTGALGLMQVQPPSNISTYGTKYNPTATDLNGIKIGLSFLGRDLDSLTKNDFCNVRTSLYLGAGVMVSKNGGKPPVTPEEVGATACKYLGSCSAGGNNYADEVKQGFENCKAAPSPALASVGECPIPNGRILCGSQFTPMNGCGHCLPGYGQPSACIHDGTRYALDINARPSQSIHLPSVNESVVQWVFARQEARASQAIQAYAGREASGKQYYLQLHHTQPGSGNTKGGTPGEVGGTIWSGGDHVHVQIGVGDNLSNTKWLDTPQYMCKKDSTGVVR